MPRKCSICSHEKCKEIDRAVIEGYSLRDIARQYATTKDAIKRHVDAGHISTKIQAAREAKDIKQGITILEKLTSLDADIDEIYNMAKKQEDPRGMCLAVKEKRMKIELEGKITGELTNKTEISGPDGSNLVINLTSASFKKPDES